MTADHTSAAPADKVFIADLVPDSRVVSYFVCSNKEVAVTRDGRDFLRLVLRDATGDIKAVLFDPSEEALCDLCAGDVVKIVGQYAESPQYGPQMKLQQLYLLGEGDYDAATLVGVSPIPLAELTDRLDTLVGGVADEDLNWLLTRALDPDREPGATYRIAPAAVRNHHAYLYGLLEHSLIVAEVAAAVADRVPQVDRDVVVAGGLLHDIGKTRAYSVDPFRPGLTDVGRLHGEIAIGYGMLVDLMRERPEFVADTAERLLHVLISHHGEREKGSPAVPMTREAVVVHYCDDMTARVAAFDEAERATPAGDRWTSFSRMMETPLYLGGAAGETGGEAGGPAAPTWPPAPSGSTAGDVDGTAGGADHAAADTDDPAANGAAAGGRPGEPPAASLFD